MYVYLATSIYVRTCIGACILTQTMKYMYMCFALVYMYFMF